jgi:hypothetical protein
MEALVKAKEAEEIGGNGVGGCATLSFPKGGVEVEVVPVNLIFIMVV